MASFVPVTGSGARPKAASILIIRWRHDFLPLLWSFSLCLSKPGEGGRAVGFV